MSDSNRSFRRALIAFAILEAAVLIPVVLYLFLHK